MPDWMRALGMAGMLCQPWARGVCQDALGAPIAGNRVSSLAHYRLGEAYVQEGNLQSAANEFREALNGNLDPAWTQVWSHIQLGRIFDATGQHERAVNEHRQAARTGDNTNGALDEANNYLQHPGQPIYELAVPRPSLRGDPIQETEPEYTEEARVAELEGTVVLKGSIDEEGFARNLEVAESIGLGLDEKAIEAVKQWHFRPVVNQSQASVTTQIPVDFRRSTKQSRWHLIQVQFNTPPGTARPVFVSAPYPIGAGLGPEAIEEGRLVVAMGRLATVKLTFEVDEHGLPAHFQMPNASEEVWGSEATALVGQWRFTPGMKNGIAVSVTCAVELVWGERDLSASNLTLVHQTMREQTAALPNIFPPATAESSRTETSRIEVDAQAQSTKLVRMIPPEYPAAARANGLRGTVRIRVLIGLEGRVLWAEAIGGDPVLTTVAAEAVKQWVYQPTLLNGAPVEVTTEADVDVGPSP